MEQDRPSLRPSAQRRPLALFQRDQSREILRVLFDNGQPVCTYYARSLSSNLRQLEKGPVRGVDDCLGLHLTEIGSVARMVPSAGSSNTKVRLSLDPVFWLSIHAWLTIRSLHSSCNIMLLRVPGITGSRPGLPLDVSGRKSRKISERHTVPSRKILHILHNLPKHLILFA
jgi:hypothetical protein